MNQRQLDRLLAKGYDFDIQEAYLKGWEMFKKYPAYSIGYTLFILSVQLLFVAYLPDYALGFGVFLAGPLAAGYYLVANKISQGDPVIYPDFFGGFLYYIPVVLVTVIGQVIIALGIFALVIPGIYLLVGYMVSVLMVLFGGLEFWPALEASRKLVHQQWVRFFLFGVVIVVINLAGLFFFMIGLVVTMPVTYYAIYHVFESLTKDVLLEDGEA